MMTRYDCLQLLASRVSDELVICNVGGVTREWSHLKHRDGNFYRTYMAGNTPIALGVALGLPHRRVISLDGDGSRLMTLNIFPVIAKQNPPNLIDIVFDNEVYASTGNLPTLTSSTANLAEIARACGIKNVRPVKELSEFEQAIDEAFKAKDTTFIPVKAQIPSKACPYVPLDGPENKYRFIRHIEETENLQMIQPRAKGKGF